MSFDIIIPWLLLFAFWIFQGIYWLVIIWIVASWMVLLGGISPGNGFFRWLTQIIEPMLRPFRFLRIGMIDLSPIILILVLNFGKNLVLALML